MEIAPDIRVVANVIGGSHLVTFYVQGKELHEVFACQNVDVEIEGRRSFYGPLREVLGNTKLEISGMGRYEFSSELKSLGGRVFTPENIEQESAPWNIRLDYKFPSDGSGVVPETIVLVRFEEAESIIRVRTAHSYPNEDILVLSHTNLVLSKK